MPIKLKSVIMAVLILLPGMGFIAGCGAVDTKALDENYRKRIAGEWELTFVNAREEMLCMSDVEYKEDGTFQAAVRVAGQKEIIAKSGNWRVEHCCLVESNINCNIDEKVPYLKLGQNEAHYAIIAAARGRIELQLQADDIHITGYRKYKD